MLFILVSIDAAAAVMIDTSVCVYSISVNKVMSDDQCIYIYIVTTRIKLMCLDSGLHLINFSNYQSMNLFTCNISMSRIIKYERMFIHVFELIMNHAICMMPGVLMINVKLFTNV